MTLQNSLQRNQRMLLLILVVGALVSIMLVSKVFPSNHQPAFSASDPVKEEAGQKRMIQSGKTIWVTCPRLPYQF